MLNVENDGTRLTVISIHITTTVAPPCSAHGPPVTNPVLPVTSFPAPDSPSSPTRRSADLAWVVCGCVVKATWVAGGGGAAVMLKLALVAPVSPLALAVSV